MTAASVPVEVLRKIPIFQNLNETECRQIADIASIVSFNPGDLILRQGKQSQNLWILLEGKCDVVRQISPEGSDSDGVILASLEPYHHFGEMSFFHPAPHSAHIRAQTPVKALLIKHSDYQDLIDEGIGAAYKLAYNVVEGLAERLRRMDEWVAELLTTQGVESQVPEWHTFREKLFNRWNG